MPRYNVVLTKNEIHELKGIIQKGGMKCYKHIYQCDAWQAYDGCLRHGNNGSHCYG